jgi:NADH:ubiquinone oxidoreductase subunit 2 (subunit N)
MYTVFINADPWVLQFVGIIGAITMLGAALLALVQDDIKRVLAYSTVSQLAYMMAALGLDYPTLSALNPRVIYASISGYGQTGPYAELPGHDLNYVSISGMLAADRPDPPRWPKGSTSGLVWRSWSA